MVRRIIWADKALKDLREIHDYIARDSRRYAEGQIKKIQDTAARTERFPKVGRIVPELPEENWRELLSGNYRYDAANEEVRILAVVHARCLLKRSMVT